MIYVASGVHGLRALSPMATLRQAKRHFFVVLGVALIAVTLNVITLIVAATEGKGTPTADKDEDDLELDKKRRVIAGVIGVVLTTVVCSMCACCAKAFKDEAEDCEASQGGARHTMPTIPAPKLQSFPMTV
jgi:hypothetical protein